MVQISECQIFLFSSKLFFFVSMAYIKLTVTVTIFVRFIFIESNFSNTFYRHKTRCNFKNDPNIHITLKYKFKFTDTSKT